MAWRARLEDCGPVEEDCESGDEPCRMLDRGDDGLASMEAKGLLASRPLGALVLALAGSSSSPNRLLMADIAGLRPAIASGVSSSEGMRGAEKSRPRLRGFDSRPEAKPPCLSMPPDCLRTKKGA